MQQVSPETWRSMVASAPQRAGFLERVIGSDGRCGSAAVLVDVRVAEAEPKRVWKSRS
jgi:hypothetical protein